MGKNTKDLKFEVLVTGNSNFAQYARLAYQLLKKKNVSNV